MTKKFLYLAVLLLLVGATVPASAWQECKNSYYCGGCCDTDRSECYAIAIDQFRYVCDAYWDDCRKNICGYGGGGGTGGEGGSGCVPGVDPGCGGTTAPAHQSTGPLCSRR